MRRLAAAVVLCTALAACSSGSSPKADLQTRMNAVIDAGNSKDAAALRTAVGEFLQEVQQQSANGDITVTKAQDLRTVATRILGEASSLETTAPPPSPPQQSSPTPSPSPTRERPSPTPSPTPVESPSSPDVAPSIGLSSSPEPSPTA